MLSRTYLPDEITLPTGEVLQPVIGGSLAQKPFLTTIDTTKNGWANGLLDSQERQLIIAEAKRRKLKYRKLNVLSRGLRGKKDLHGRSYTGNVYVFVEVPKADTAE